MTVSVEVSTPLAGQVVLFASDSAELPQWVTGAEVAVASNSALAIATRSDLDGGVLLRLSIGAAPPGSAVFECVLSLRSGTVQLGSYLSNELGSVEVEPGDWVARVWVDVPGTASEVWVSLTR